MTDLKTSLDTLEALIATREPTLHALLPEPGRFERLRREAAALGARYPDPATRPPLFGALIAVKDIFHVEGFVTRAGSKLPESLLQGPQAASVTLLKQAGALILGKAVPTEFAFFGPGPTTNPRDPARTPGGSSSGSAAAVAAGYAPLALGTQTIGSILRPASFCGVYGYKPTYERVSRAGVIPLSRSYDHVGLLAADLTVLERALRALIPDWSLDPAAWGASRPSLGIPEGHYLRRCGTDMEVRFRNAITRLVRAGYSVRSVPMFPDFEAIRDRQYALTAFECAEVHAAWYDAHRNLYHPKTAELIERGRTVPASIADVARDARLTLRDEIARVMRVERIDVWLSPPAIGAATRGLASTGDPVMNLPWTQAGLPVLGLPMDEDDDGMPLGLQLTGGFGADEALLGWAAGIDAVVTA
jgi:Asp-tRNA(Asn)/Glu-tRNA(Gln) amidotransferase A subunit family amidase